MSSNAYTEDQLVEQPAKAEGPPSPWPSPSGRRNEELLAELGWAIAFGNPHPGPLPAGEGVIVDELGLLGRETMGEVVLVSRLRAAHSALPNPQPGLAATLLPLGEGPGDEGAQLALPPEAITAAVDELTRDRSGMRRSLEHVELASVEQITQNAASKR
jgi:type I restriction enzyme, R subunit